MVSARTSALKRIPDTGRDVGGEYAAPLLNEIDRRLGEAGHRWTAGRREIADVFVRADRPLSVPDVQQRATSVPLSSVYRIIASLVEAKVLVKLGFGPDFAHYELDESLHHHHHHLACKVCGSVSDVDLGELEAVLSKVAKTLSSEHGFEVETHRLDFFGVCRSCR